MKLPTPLVGENEVFQDLTIEEIQFCQLVVAGKNPISAARLAGLAVAGLSPAAKAKREEQTRRLLAMPKVGRAIRALLRAKLLEASTQATDTLIELAKGAKSQKTRLEASVAILDRAGIDVPKGNAGTASVEAGDVKITIDLGS